MRRSLVVLALSGIVWMGCGRDASRETPASGTDAEVAQAVDSEAASEPMSESDALHRDDPTGTYGTPIAVAETAAITDLNRNPEQFLGRTFVVEGVVSQVCPMRGCWIDLADAEGEATIRVKVEDGVIVFPLSAKGRRARVEGTLEKIELSEEDARGWRQHEAAELGEAFDPATVTGPQIIWRVRGQGAEIAG